MRAGKDLFNMKTKLKTAALLVFLIGIICTSAAFAEYSETLFKEFKPDGFMVEATYTPKDGTPVTYPLGTLPTYENGYLWSNTVPSGLNPGLALRMRGSGRAVYENGTDGNVVFKIGGAEDCGLSGAANLGKHSTYRQSIRMKILDHGSSRMCVLATVPSSGPYYSFEETSKCGVYFMAGGAYVYDYDKEENVYFIEEGTLETNKWYTVEAYTDFQGTNLQMQNAKVYDGTTGALIAQSGWTRVSELEPQGGLQNFCAGTSKAVAPTVMLDDWKVYKCEGVDRTTFTIEAADSLRKVYKMKSDMELDGSLFNADTVLLAADNEELDLTGKYTVSYDETEKAVVITLNEALPYNESFKIQIKCLPSAKSGMLAVDSSNKASLTQAFSTGSDLFKVEGAALDSGNAVVTMSNPTGESREYLVIVSSISEDGKYLETKCVHSSLLSGASNTPVTVSAINMPANGKIWIKVWDNWKNMNSLSDMYEIPVH